MSTDRRMYKEDVVHVYSRILALKKKKNEIKLPTYGNWLDPEIIILSEVR